MAMRYWSITSGDCDGFAVDEDFAGVGLFQADDVLEEDAFAAAAGAHDDEDLAGLDLEVQAR